MKKTKNFARPRPLAIPRGVKLGGSSFLPESGGGKVEERWEEIYSFEGELTQAADNNGDPQTWFYGKLSGTIEEQNEGTFELFLDSISVGKSTGIQYVSGGTQGLKINYDETPYENTWGVQIAKKTISTYISNKLLNSENPQNAGTHKIVLKRRIA